ncbi:O-antigen ligase family protein [Sediminibacillus massiliensis]|uniref:O-antigen ligase family protein n=1 Tax=Sediminibacillus massiliensis TaxID=1926277 RepID=UPI0009889151|nr:hypothetical protein [Sediminibacillus massiliensis]
MLTINKRRENIVIGAVAIPFLLLIGFYPILTAGIIIAILGLCVTFYFFVESNYKMIYFLFVVSIIQNTVVIYLMGNLGISQAYELQYYKELFLLGLLGYLLLFKNRLFHNLTRIDFVSILFIFYVLTISVWLGDANNFTKIASLRQVMLPFIFYFLGKHIVLSRSNLKKLLTKLHVFGVIIVLFGIFESYLYPEFWQDIGIYNFFLEKRGQEALTMVNGLPSNFYTSDFVKYTGQMLRRTASFVSNPPVLAHIIGFLAVFSLFNRKYIGKSWFSILFLSAGVFLTLGKGGIITLAIGFGFYLLFVLKRPFLSYILGCLGVLGAAAYINKVIKQGLSAVDHIFGFTNSFKEGLEHPFGSGLGTVGNLAEVYNGNATVSEGAGAESFLGLVVGQFGVIGFALFSLFFILIFNRLMKFLKLVSDDKFLYSVSVSLLAVMVAIFSTAFLTESAISYTSAGIPILLSSILINNYKILLDSNENEEEQVKKGKLRVS